jgi:molybdate transport system permease protein
MRSGPVHVLAAVAVALLAVPAAALLVAIPWQDLPTGMGADSRTALGLSLGTATASAAVAGLVGVPLGWVLARDPRWSALRPVVLLPLVLPPVVAGVALDALIGGGGLLGLDLAGGPTAVVLAQVVVALPWCALSVETAVRQVDPRLEEVAVLHGMSPAAVLRRVTLPAARGGIAAGLALAWARALGEFGATITLAGSIPGRTETAPTALYLRAQADGPAAGALALVLLVVAVAVVVALRDRIALGPR